MLTPVQPKSFQARDASFAIVASLYNARYVNAMVRAAKAELKRAGARQVQVLRVPGAYEIPIVAARLASEASGASPAGPGASPLARHSPPSAIVCLGVILRGETDHAALIGEAVTQALMQIQLRYLVPVVHEVLLLENEDQARARCLSKTHNRGAEAAQTALAMARILPRARGR
jgi:6,7-dimethyl-8-ribityllumazine synthase